ncbi:protoporphyrinogen oxidase [Aeoliella mucimassa]|nr:protoporphyrinogen oxidase [Aeoliella mucimassa]
MNNNDQTSRSVAIVGGGISGLATAWRLKELKPHWRVVVHEGNDRPGGVIQTRRQDDFTFELGPDSILSRLPWGVGLCKRLGLEGELIGTEAAARGVYTVHRGRATRMPEGLAIMAPERMWPIVTTPILSPWGKMRLAAERLVARRTDPSDESLADFARRRVGKEAFERIVQPLAGGIFMGDPERLSLRSCFPQFAGMEAEHGSLIKATQAAKKKAPPATNGKPASVFVAPARGLGRIIETLAEKLGDAVQLGSRVESAQKLSDGWQLTIQQGEGHSSFTEQYNAVVVATPAKATAAIIDQIEPRIADIMRGIEYSSCAIVQLVYNRSDVPHPLDASGMVVPHVEGRPLQACSFSSVKYAGRAPDGSVVLRLFFGGALKPELVDLDESALQDLACNEAASLLGVTAKPQATIVKQWKSSMPQYYVGHAERIDEVMQLVAQHHGLELAGAALHGVGIPHCIHTAESTAERLVEQLEADEPQSSGQTAQTGATT